ncbi:pentatricopeptide repeat-containing protein At4g02750-like [Cryptomeria japonica]|uniref:pentatricopeptide repeat-containing protein At4g02750-like n=1 Tax=Cryptomeria japonica TaxID=3369 RepID=UPI0027DA07F0|nr:pentatricopeptide repeat-containing protein At4g02750-like [Cryptomeria japonica]
MQNPFKDAIHVVFTSHNATNLQLLQSCIAKNTIGKLFYFNINNRGFTDFTNTLFQNTLINMYGKCGNLMDARKVFDHMIGRDSFSWNTVIAAYQRHGFPQEALTLFSQMQGTVIQCDQFTFGSILAACAKMGALEQGTEIHKAIIESGLLLDVIVGTALTDMYVKCGSMMKARELFDKMPHRNVASWNAMISGYAQNGVLDEAVRLFKEMPQQNVISWNTMIAGYAQNGFLVEALRLFKEMPQRNVVSWIAIIAGYAKNGFLEMALDVFKQMQSVNVKPNPATFAIVLPVCAKMGALKQGMEIHQKIIESSFFSNVIIKTALMDMYAKCGSIKKSRKLFDKINHPNVISWTGIIAGYAQNGFLDEALRLFIEMPQRDVVAWNAIIAGYAQNGLVEEALQKYEKMQMADVNPNAATFASLLPACVEIGALEQGMEIHQRIIKTGFSLDIVVVTTLIDMYAKCGSIQKAHELFDKMPQRSLVSWNAMIAGYTQNGLLDKALRTFKDMPQRNVLSWNLMIVGYAQNGFLEEAITLFKGMPQKDVVSWSAIISGHAQNGFVLEALEIFKESQQAGVEPNSAIFASILPACTKLGALEHCKEVHLKIIEHGFLSDVVVVNALIDMYAKCGNIRKARGLFDKTHQPNVVSWTVMVAGYAMHGYSTHALKLFELMKQSGTNPDHISFISVLFACSHAGLVDEGCKYFKCMSDSYCIMPAMDHYACIVDLLGRANYLEESLNFIIKMPIKPDVVVWMCLLGSCRSHKSIELGKFTAALLSEFDPRNATPHVLLSNINAELGRWGEVQKIREMVKHRGIKKIPGCSWIEVQNMVHTFCVGDTSQPHAQETYSNLGELSWETKATGYSG